MLKAHEISLDDAQRLKGYTWENKYDGFRSFFVNGKLLSDRGINENNKFPQIVNTLLSHNVVLDGEIALADYSTVHKINAKENWNKATYFIFDILSLDNHDFTDLAYHIRRKKLEQFISENKLSGTIELAKQFPDFHSGWAYVQQNNLEGLIAKDYNSRYHSLSRYDLIKDVFRVKVWRKLKNWRENKLEIIGYEAGKFHGTFIMAGNHRISALSPKIVWLYNQLREHGKVYAEFYYLYLTENQNYFQPRLKRIVG